MAPRSPPCGALLLLACVAACLLLPPVSAQVSVLFSPSPWRYGLIINASEPWEFREVPNESALRDAALALQRSSQFLSSLSEQNLTRALDALTNTFSPWSLAPCDTTIPTPPNANASACSAFRFIPACDKLITTECVVIGHRYNGRVRGSANTAVVGFPIVPFPSISPRNPALTFSNPTLDTPPIATLTWQNPPDVFVLAPLTHRVITYVGAYNMDTGRCEGTIIGNQTLDDASFAAGVPIVTLNLSRIVPAQNHCVEILTFSARYDASVRIEFTAPEDILRGGISILSATTLAGLPSFLGLRNLLPVPAPGVYEAVDMCWQPVSIPSSPPQPIDGPKQCINNFTIRPSGAGGASSAEFLGSSADGVLLLLRFSQLQPYTCYNLTYRIYTSRGPSPTFEYNSHCSQEDIPDAPESVQIDVPTALLPDGGIPNITVSWRLFTRPRGRILMRQLHTEANPATGLLEVVVAQFPRGVTSYTIDRENLLNIMGGSNPPLLQLKLRAVTSVGPGPFSNVTTVDVSNYLAFTAEKPKKSSSGTPTTLIIVANVGVVGFLIAGVVTALLYRSRRQAEINKFVFPEPDFWEYDRRKVVTGRKLGSGAFGLVMQATVTDIQVDLPGQTVVAIKMCNISHSTVEDKMRFLAEAQIMKRFSKPSHRNVIRLLGVCTQSFPLIIITELAEHGDLKRFLRSCRPDTPNHRDMLITLVDLVGMARDIADGMVFLSANLFVHRDLSARNCLVTEDLTVKIADFGMSKDVQYLEYYRKQGETLLPVRWMAPECLLDGVFTTDSDVWSFGVVLWEIFTLGNLPYPGWNNAQVHDQVVRGYRMEQPPGCPDTIFVLMRECWEAKRPHFPEIRDRLDYFHKILSSPLSSLNIAPGVPPSSASTSSQRSESSSTTKPADSVDNSATSSQSQHVPDHLSLSKLKLGNHEHYYEQQQQQHSPGEDGTTLTPMLGAQQPHTFFQHKNGCLTPTRTVSTPTRGRGNSHPGYLQLRLPMVSPSQSPDKIANNGSSTTGDTAAGAPTSGNGSSSRPSSSLRPSETYSLLSGNRRRAVTDPAPVRRVATCPTQQHTTQHFLGQDVSSSSEQKLNPSTTSNETMTMSSNDVLSPSSSSDMTAITSSGAHETIINMPFTSLHPTDSSEHLLEADSGLPGNNTKAQRRPHVHFLEDEKHDKESGERAQSVELLDGASREPNNHVHVVVTQFDDKGARSEDHKVYQQLERESSDPELSEIMKEDGREIELSFLPGSALNSERPRASSVSII